MCKSKKQTEQTNPVTEEQYPRYLSNHPQGEDLFEGKSQERLANAIAMHITDTDKVENPVYARLIGLEGKWGSGKSNVIKILEDKLKDNYIFFNFDAWGNQEDLQRRSILESLTRKLIKDEVLQGNVKIQMRNGKINDAPWDDQLTFLLSNKTTSIRKSTPKLTPAAFWGIAIVVLFAICSLFAGQLIDTSGDFKCYWWIDVIPIVLAFVVALWYRIKDGSFDNIFRMVDHTNNDTVEEEFTSSEEPSVVEFKNWMNAISDSIGGCKHKQKKLVLVFDNMDRLPSEKVRQFWSLIQTFFADDGYKNIWCIVPYDENHLAVVFKDSEEEDANMDLLRGFLDKTFPLVYRVPEPIVSDYNKLFVSLFCKAFGTTVSEEELELISQCYRLEHPVPNVREIVSFVNSNVKLERQWKDSVKPISRALYVLKEDEILHHPQMNTKAKDVFKLKESTIDEYLLERGYYMDFVQILMGSVDVLALQREIVALVYGINPENADQVLFKRFIQSCLVDKGGKSSFAKYVDNPNFILLLNDVVHNLSIAEYVKIVPLINEIEADKLLDDNKKLLQKIWNFFAARYISIADSATEYKDYEQMVFSHVDANLAKRCVKTFCQRLIRNNEVGGAQLYDQLIKVFNEDYAEAFDANEICPASELSANRFADYVERAKDDYKRFPFKTNADELNKIIERGLDGALPYLDVLTLLKNDKDYSVSEVGKYAVQELNHKKANASVASTLIAVQRIFYPKLQSKLDPAYISSLWQEVHADRTKESYNEIYTLKTIGVYEQLPDDDHHIDVLLDKVFFYTNTKQIISDYLKNCSIRFRSVLLKKMILENIHDNEPDYPEFVEKWQTLVNTLGLGKDVIVRFANHWGYKTVSEVEKGKNYFTLLGDVAWIDTLLKENTPLAQELLAMCVNEMSQQTINQYVLPNTANPTGSPYCQALQKLVATDYITSATFGIMNEIAGQILDFVAKSAVVNDTTWNTLLDKVSYASISSKVGEIRNNILNGQRAYAMNPAKFQFLHGWLEQAEINSPSHCSDTANQILTKVVGDENCQAIILQKKEYYKPIIVNTVSSASALHDQLRAILKKQSDSEFAKYIDGIVNYSE